MGHLRGPDAQEEGIWMKEVFKLVDVRMDTEAAAAEPVPVKVPLPGGAVQMEAEAAVAEPATVVTMDGSTAMATNPRRRPSSRGVLTPAP